MDMSLEDRRSLISIRVQMLITVFGKKVSLDSLTALTRVFCDGLDRFPVDCLVRGFTKAEQDLERFPTPKVMRELCSEFSATQQDVRRGCEACDFTGWKLVDREDKKGKHCQRCECRRAA